MISELKDVEQMAHIGVMLLLFSIGVEFSTEKLMRLRTMALGGGLMQVGLTLGATALVVRPYVGSLRLALFAGILVALSSTVIAMRILQDRGQAFAPQWSASLALLIFQDLAVVPIMLFMPILSGRESFQIYTFATTLVIAIVAIAVILIAASYIVPRIIRATIASRSRDIFILSVIVIVLGIAYLTSRAGLSTALGAFIAGIVISESEYSHQVLSDVLPLRETFNSLFFVSIGMLLEPGFLLANAGLVLLLSAAVLIGKTVITTGIVTLLGMPVRIAMMVGLYLGQIGEFSLVLLTAARAMGALPGGFDQIVLSVTLVTMVVASFMASIADRVGRWEAGARPISPAVIDLSDHTIVIGYGLNGQNVAAALRARSMPYVILEMNPRAVRTARAKGEPIYYGDAVSEVVLSSLGISRAQCARLSRSPIPLQPEWRFAAARRINAETYIIAPHTLHFGDRTVV